MRCIILKHGKAKTLTVNRGPGLRMVPTPNHAKVRTTLAACMTHSVRSVLGRHQHEHIQKSATRASGGNRFHNKEVETGTSSNRTGSYQPTFNVRLGRAVFVW